MVCQRWLLFTIVATLIAFLHLYNTEAIRECKQARRSLHKEFHLRSVDEGSRQAVKLEEIIPEEYDSMQTPMVNGQPTNVSLQIVILNIRSVDVSQMSYTADIFLHKLWTDNRLRFPDHVKDKKVVMNPEWRQHIWTPDVFFLNAVEGKVHETIIPYMYLWMNWDSSVFFAARLAIEFSCDMDLKMFPHDIQECDIIIMSLTHTVEEMNLQWMKNDSVKPGDLIVLPQFEIVSMEASNCSRDSTNEPGKFSCLRGIIRLQRRSGYYIINIYIPTILIVFMSMLTFWIPPDAVPARVTLGVTSLLTIVTKQYQASLPSVSYIVGLNIWLSSCIGFVFCSLLEYSMVIALHTRQRKLQHAKPKSPPTEETAEQESSRKRKMFFDLWSCNKIDRISRICFPVAFIAQAILYCIVYAR